MTIDVLVFFATLIVMGGLPWLAWVVARRRGANDRSFVLFVALGCVFIVYGVVSLVFQRWWSGLYGVVFGAGQLVFARSLRHARQKTNAATPPV